MTALQQREQTFKKTPHKARLTALCGVFLALRQYRTKSVWRLCTPSACKFPVIFHKNAREYIQYSLRFLFHLTKNLTTHLSHNLCAVLPHAFAFPDSPPPTPVLPKLFAQFERSGFRHKKFFCFCLQACAGSVAKCRKNHAISPLLTIFTNRSKKSPQFSPA